METTREPFCKCLHEIENDLPRTKFCFMPCRDQSIIISNREAAKWWKGLSDDEKSNFLIEYNLSENDSIEIYKKEMRKKMLSNINKDKNV